MKNLVEKKTEIHKSSHKSMLVISGTI